MNLFFAKEILVSPIIFQFYCVKMSGKLKHLVKNWAQTFRFILFMITQHLLSKKSDLNILGNKKTRQITLLSIVLSKFLMKTLPTPERRRLGSRWLHIIRMGLPFSTSKFIVSRALSAAKKIIFEKLDINSYLSCNLIQK